MVHSVLSWRKRICIAFADATLKKFIPAPAIQQNTFLHEMTSTTIYYISFVKLLQIIEDSFSCAYNIIDNISFPHFECKFLRKM